VSGTVGNGTAMVTGSSSGIGAAVAAKLAGEGWRVVGLDRAPPTAGSGLASTLAIDLADADALAAAAPELRGARALVHAAGFMRTASLATLDLRDGAAMWAVHVQALTVLAQVLAPAMGKGGRIVAIGSRTSAGAANKSQYAACKAAVTALIRSWAIELAGAGVTANVVAPAATATQLLADPARADVAPVLPPIGRYIEPAEIAAYVAFLLTPDAAAITGQELLVCGGASL